MMRHNRRPLDDVLIDTTDRDGHRWSVSPSGWMHPVVSGAEGEPAGSGEGGQGETGRQSGTGSGTSQPVGISAAEVERREKEARKAAEKDLLAQFGEGMTPDKIKAVLDAQKAADDAKKDELTKAQEAAAERERKAEERERKASERERAANVRAALLEAGVKPDRLSHSTDLVKVSDDADEDAIKSAVEKFKADTPEWFPTGPPAGPTNLPTGPRPVNHTNSGIAAGRERARKEREARSANQPAFGEGLTVVGGP